LKIALPGDTSFPTQSEEIKKIYNAYKEADILSLHLGSLEEGWADESKDSSAIKYGEGKHLGLIGVVKMLNLLAPRAAIISEFGEELDLSDVRLQLINIIGDMAIGQTKILPSDLGLQLSIMDGKLLFKCKCGEFSPIQHISMRKAQADFLIIQLLAVAVILLWGEKDTSTLLCL
jgi:hypothetical protein